MARKWSDVRAEALASGRITEDALAYEAAKIQGELCAARDRHQRLTALRRRVARLLRR